MNSTFDITLTSYKRPGLLEAAIRSCLTQGPRLRKVIVVDDGSKDNTAEMVRAIGDERIIFYERERNGGIAAARRDAFALSEADWTIKLDSDHELLPGAIEGMAVLAEQAGSNVDILGARYRWDNGALSPILMPKEVIDYKGRIQYASRPDSIGLDYLYAISRRIRAIVHYEPLRTSFPDTLFQLDLAKNGNAAFTGKVLALEKSCTDHSWTRGTARDRWARRVQDSEDGVKCLKIIEDRHGAALQSCGKPILSNLLATGALFAALSGNRATALRWSLRGARLQLSRLSISSLAINVLPKHMLAIAYKLRG